MKERVNFYKQEKRKLSRLKVTSQKKLKDILEMNGRKAIPLRALIVRGKRNLSNFRWYRV